LSRGLPMSRTRYPHSSITLAEQVLSAVPFFWEIGQWLLATVGLRPDQSYRHVASLDPWKFHDIYGGLTIWNPTPELARQALRSFLDIWVEGATITSGIFVIPRVLQRDWGYISKHIREVAVVYPCQVPVSMPFVSHVPFIVLYVPPYVRTLPPPDSLESLADHALYPRWVQEQADAVRGLQ
jgi:hypothetical protein